MKTRAIIFYLFSFITIVSAVFVVFNKKVVYSAFSLMFTFLGVAGLYVLLGADFLAITQILIYVGAILVLLLFGVMLTRADDQDDIKMQIGTMKLLPALIIASGILLCLWWVIVRSGWIIYFPLEYSATTREIGKLLMTDFLLPFEIASVLLLIALIGAANYARREEK